MALEENMARFTAGLIVGLFIGIAALQCAAIYIGQGDSDGWTVTILVEEACSDRAVDKGAKEIKCP
jgi:hypothetical protein